MQKKFLSLFAGCFLLIAGLTANAEKPAPFPAGDTLPPCTLPAPSNLQKTFPNPVQVTYTWNSVAGAWGYFIAVMDQNTANVSTFTTTATTITAGIIPGHTYDVRVFPKCTESPGDISIYYAHDSFKASGIVIELIVEASGCGSLSSPVTNNTSTPNTFEVNGVWTLNQNYYIQLNSPVQGGNPVALLLRFKRKEVYENGQPVVHYELQEIGNPNNCALQGILSINNNAFYVDPPANTGDGKLIYDGKTFTIQFINDSKFEFSMTADNNGSTFDPPSVYAVCSRKNGMMASGSGSGIIDLVDPVPAPNPFSGELVVYFSDSPIEPVKTRLIDLQGGIRIETELQPGENAYQLPTEDLPAGMYFLQLEVSPGQWIARKVMKR